MLYIQDYCNKHFMLIIIVNTCCDTNPHLPMVLLINTHILFYSNIFWVPEIFFLKLSFIIITRVVRLYVFHVSCMFLRLIVHYWFKPFLYGNFFYFFFLFFKYSLLNFSVHIFFKIFTFGLLLATKTLHMSICTSNEKKNNFNEDDNLMGVVT